MRVGLIGVNQGHFQNKSPDTNVAGLIMLKECGR